MTNDEIISTLKMAAAEVEWNYPLDYAAAIEEAIKLIEGMERGETNGVGDC